MLGRVACALPVGSVAWRVNLLTALLGAASAAVLFLAVRAWTKSPWAGLLAAGLFAFSPLVWRYSVVTEVFTLNDLFTALMLWLAIRFDGERRFGLLAAGAFVAGLGMTNHQTFLFVAAPLGVWALVRAGRSFLTPRRVLVLAGLLLLGLGPYLYLPLADAREPLLRWQDLTTLDGFLGHVLRRDYGTFRLYSGDTGTGLADLGLFFRELPAGTLYVGVVLAAVGLVASIRREGFRGYGAATLYAWLLYLVVFHALANLPIGDALHREVHRRFFLMPLVLTGLWAGAGFAVLAARWPERARILAPIAAAAGFLLPIGLNGPAADESGTRTVERYGAALLDTLPEGALLIARGDLPVNVARYLGICEGRRPDVDLVPVVYEETRVGPIVEAALDRRPVFLVGLPAAEFDRWPYGIADRVTRRYAPIDVPAYVRSAREAIAAFAPEDVPPARPGSWEEVVRTDGLRMELRLANRLLNAAQERPGQREEFLSPAIRIFEELSARPERRTPELWRNLGVAWYLRRDVDPRAKAKARAAWGRYLAAPDEGDPDYARIRDLHASLVEEGRR